MIRNVWTATQKREWAARTLMRGREAHQSAMLDLVRRGQTYLYLLYVLLAFPLGLFYFVLLVTGLAVGMSTTIIWIGIPILLALIATWRRLAAFERHLVTRWLRVDVSPQWVPIDRPSSRWAALRSRLVDPITWKGLLYLLLEFPFGVLSFGLVVPLLVAGVVVAAVFLPLGMLASLLTFSPRRAIWLNLRVFFPLGLGLFAFSLLVAKSLAWLWGQFARRMLGVSDTALRLARAEATAEQERARAERAEQRRRELIVSASHELRTPIASIRGHVETLLMANEAGAQGILAPEKQTEYLAIVSREVARLGALVDDLLSLARAESGELHLQMTSVCLADVVDEVFQALEPLAAREREVMLVREVPDDLPPVLADRQRLAQVVLNLVRNAITYTPTGGIVAVTVEPADGGQLALVVADTGIGIPPDDLDRVFERFYRTDASRARASGGFGLGLAIVHDLVAAMGGSIGVESSVGEGSRFRLLLRIAAPGSGDPATRTMDRNEGG